MTVEEFISKWLGVKGGAERANYGQFINDLCHALTLPLPEVAEGGSLGNYQFEGPVQGGGVGGKTGAIDLYKRGHFILEAKQSKLSAADRQQAELFDVGDNAPVSPSGARYDKLMRDALAQAKRYAVNLPSDHPWPPFLIVCDVGRAFEVYFDWSGNGRGYGYFPDQHSYRFELPRLAEPDVQVMFRAIWTDPKSIDPRAQSAEVSRDIAKRLADVSQWLEKTQRARTSNANDAAKSLAIEETALFLMRIIFCMFAEDVGLLPTGSFTEFLKKTVDNEAAFEPELRQLWGVMGQSGGNRYASAIGGNVRYFNGGLFASTNTYRLSNADRGELYAASKYDWTRVEPAIFGTLLEQALTPSERAKLGAHYTPRPYVERLVQATIMDVLDGEWAEVIAGEPNGLLRRATTFHERIAGLRILDPACGTGNFLYVAMENLMRLEGDVIETIRQLGATAEPVVGPQQFLGLELNPRAAVIAELVLWIGWLRWRMKNDPDAAPEPVLKQFGNINFGGHAGYDAVLRRTATGQPDVENPMIPDWPEAEFIIGNPPFIGKGSAMRDALGDEYVETLRKANPRVPKSADFVMQWWDHCAVLLARPNSTLRRFGLVTTNLIKGSLNRKLIEHHLMSDEPVSIVFAVPDHPWTKASKDAAAVRIAMTVVEAGASKLGVSMSIVREAGLKSDEPIIELSPEPGLVHSNLKTGTDLTSSERLTSNRGLSSNGMMLAGSAFKVSKAEKDYIINADGSDAPVKPYVAGAEIMQLPKYMSVIDMFGMSEREARTRFPACYSRLLHLVKPGREGNRKSYRAERWWEFGENNPLMRESLVGLTRYIATTETTKHRVFQFLDSSVLPDHMIIAISLDDPFFLGVLSSTFHVSWTFAISSPLGVATMAQGHRYNKSQIFDPFPFPDATPEQRASIAELGEELDATRKAALAEVPGLTMTEIYNWREKFRVGSLTDLLEIERSTAARAGIVDRLHEQIDEAVAEAYGWPGGLQPAEIVARLVALNQERAEEEKQGKVRWLRPDYQIPRFAKGKADPASGPG